MIPNAVIEEGIENGELAILNISDGDTKLTFDESNPEEVARVKKIIEDMFKRGYMIFVEVNLRGGKKGLRRVKRFNPKRNTYIVGDVEGKLDEPAAPDAGTKRSKRGDREIPAKRARATGIGRTSGG